MQLSRAAATAAAVGLLLCIAAVPTARAERDTLAMSDWALTNKAFGAPHERREYELPDGVKQNSPEANNYWTRWVRAQRGPPFYHGAPLVFDASSRLLVAWHLTLMLRCTRVARQLQCSTLVTWCTVEEVLCGCGSGAPLSFFDARVT